MGVNHTWGVQNIMKAFVCLSALLVAASAAPSAQLVGYGGGQTSHQSVSRPYGEQRSIVQSKAFGAAHASVHQVDNSKGLSEVQPAYGANRPVAHLGAYHAAPCCPSCPYCPCCSSLPCCPSLSCPCCPPCPSCPSCPCLSCPYRPRCSSLSRPYYPCCSSLSRPYCPRCSILSRPHCPRRSRLPR